MPTPIESYFPLSGPGANQGYDDIKQGWEIYLINPTPATDPWQGGGFITCSDGATSYKPRINVNNLLESDIDASGAQQTFYDELINLNSLRAADGGNGGMLLMLMTIKFSTDNSTRSVISFGSAAVGESGFRFTQSNDSVRATYVGDGVTNGDTGQTVSTSANYTQGEFERFAILIDMTSTPGIGGESILIYSKTRLDDLPSSAGLMDMETLKPEDSGQGTPASTYFAPQGGVFGLTIGTDTLASGGQAGSNPLGKTAGFDEGMKDIGFIRTDYDPGSDMQGWIEDYLTNGGFPDTGEPTSPTLTTTYDNQVFTLNAAVNLNVSSNWSNIISDSFTSPDLPIGLSISSTGTITGNMRMGGIIDCNIHVVGITGQKMSAGFIWYERL